MPAEATLRVDLGTSRERPEEQARIGDLMAMVPPAHRQLALDVGARDGYLSYRLAELFERVVALDLQCPDIANPRIQPIQGDASQLPLPDESFDLVLCAEVLEHIPPPFLSRACDELTRVARHYVLIGVPYRQDTRVGRTRCSCCGQRNPPWGHVNSFDERRLLSLFPRLTAERFSYVGRTAARTNPISALLMDVAGNPYGTYDQQEHCIHCGNPLGPPPQRRVDQRVATKVAFLLDRVQRPFCSPHANWIHVLFVKR